LIAIKKSTITNLKKDKENPYLSTGGTIEDFGDEVKNVESMKIPAQTPKGAGHLRTTSENFKPEIRTTITKKDTNLLYGSNTVISKSIVNNPLRTSMKKSINTPNTINDIENRPSEKDNNIVSSFDLNPSRKKNPSNFQLISEQQITNSNFNKTIGDNIDNKNQVNDYKNSVDSSKFEQINI